MQLCNNEDYHCVPVAGVLFPFQTLYGDNHFKLYTLVPSPLHDNRLTAVGLCKSKIVTHSMVLVYPLTFELCTVYMDTVMHTLVCMTLAVQSSLAWTTAGDALVDCNNGALAACWG